MEENKAFLLHIESSTDVCSVALSQGSELIAIKERAGERNHATIMTLFVEELMQQKGLPMDALEAVVLSEGPGSYTSLRVGMSVAKGLCYGLGIPLIAVNTLEALAWAARAECEGSKTLICPMIDARRMEVYASLYDENMRLLLDNQAMILDEHSFDHYLDAGHSILFCGNGANKAMPLFDKRDVSLSTPSNSAQHLIKPGVDSYLDGKFADLAYFSPNYIKSPNITLSKKKLL